MPCVSLADGDLHYQLDGPVGAPVLILSNSLGTDLNMWDAQVPVFSKHFRVLRYDTRGHGKSLVTPGPYSIEQLGRDVLALADALDIEAFSFCGLSMGGLVGQWLAINASARIQGLVLCNTAAKIGSPEVWNPRIETVLRDGKAAMQALRNASIARWFTPEFAAAQPALVEPVVGMLTTTSPQGYAANCAAVRDSDFREQLSAITASTLIICGTADAVTTPEHGRFMQAHISNAKWVEFHAAHLSNVEAGEVFTHTVCDFLTA